MADSATFAALVDAFVGRPGVEPPGSGGRGFGSDALKANGKIFAMCPRDRLVVKLPAARIAELIDNRTAAPFDAGKGKPLREWATVQGADPQIWWQLAEEAYAFALS